MFRCARCLDPSENGSFNSCLVCPGGGGAECAAQQQYLMPRDAGALWRCDGCGRQSSVAEVKVRRELPSLRFRISKRLFPGCVNVG